MQPTHVEESDSKIKPFSFASLLRKLEVGKGKQSMESQEVEASKSQRSPRYSERQPGGAASGLAGSGRQEASGAQAKTQVSTKEVLEQSEKAAEEGNNALKQWGKALDNWGSASIESNRLLRETQETLEEAEKALTSSREALEADRKAEKDVKKAVERAFEFLEDSKQSLESLQNTVLEVSKAAEESVEETNKPNEAVKGMEGAAQAMKKLLETAEETLEELQKPAAGSEELSARKKEPRGIWERIRVRGKTTANLGEFYESQKKSRETRRAQANAWHPFEGMKFREEDLGVSEATLRARRGAPPEVWEVQKQAEEALKNMVEAWKVLMDTVYYQSDQQHGENAVHQEKFEIYFELRSMIREWKSLQREIEKARRKKHSKELLNSYWSNWEHDF